MYREYKQNIMASSSKSLKVVLFLGTVRENRLGERVAKFMQSVLEKTNHEVDLFDPQEIPFPLLSKPIHFYKDRSEAPQWLQAAAKKVAEADAYIVVSAEYNHSIPPALSNMLDHFPGSAMSYKPSGIVCYSPGIYGGMRAAMQLRAMLGEIGCISVSNIFGIPKVHESIDEDGKAKNEYMEKGALNLLKQLDWMAHAMKNHRQSAGVP